MFYYSKTILFEVWEGLGSCLFPIVFLDLYFYSILSAFSRFIGPQGLHRVPNGSLLGDFGNKVNAKLVTLVASWFQSGSHASKRSHLGHFWGVFWTYFEEFFE